VKGYWANLRPFERRVVVVVGAIFFSVLNLLFVFPYFHEWGKLEERMFQAQRKLKLYESVTSQTNVYAREVKLMEREGLEVPAEDQVRHFANAIDAQAGKSGVNLTQGGRTTQTTNQFFIEQTRTITALSPEQPLVDFLYNLGSGQSSLIRVRDMNLQPDPQKQQLNANITLAASYQKKTAAKPATSGTAPASTGSKPASPSAVTPGAQPVNQIKK
jgi:hypothetical protein